MLILNNNVLELFISRDITFCVSAVSRLNMTYILSFRCRMFAPVDIQLHENDIYKTENSQVMMSMKLYLVSLSLVYRTYTYGVELYHRYI